MIVDRRTRELPIELSIPGIIGGGGINRSLIRRALPYNQTWTANNIEPITQGVSNRNIGVTKLNTSRLNTAPVRAIFKHGSNLYFVSDGDFASMPSSGGSQTLITNAAFNASAFPSWTYGVGASRTDKVYICDGVNEPKTWDGSSLSNITAFGSDILTEIKTSNKPDKVTTYAERVIWGFPSNGVNKNYVLGSDLLNGDAYTSGAGVNNAWFEIVGGGESHITAINSIKRAGGESDNELLVVHKENKSFTGIYDSSAGNNRFGVFTAFAQGIGAVNHRCSIPFLNSIYTLSKQGIGGLSNVADDISAAILQEGIRVNPLIKDASLNLDFSKAFGFHCPERQIIWFTMPQTAGTSTTYEGITYPETPNNLSICYKYALTTSTGEITDFWYTRNGPGWAWSCVFVDGKDIYLGSYFGDIYKLFDGNEYERNPSTPNTRQPITSYIESGDMNFETGFTKYKELASLNTHWYVDAGLTANFYAVWDESDVPIGSIGKVIGGAAGAALWDVALWDVAYWSDAINTDVDVTPPDGGRTLRLIVEWDSEIDSIANHGAFYGMSGTIIDGGRILRFK